MTSQPLPKLTWTISIRNAKVKAFKLLSVKHHSICIYHCVACMPFIKELQFSKRRNGKLTFMPSAVIMWITWKRGKVSGLQKGVSADIIPHEQFCSPWYSVKSLKSISEHCHLKKVSGRAQT